MAKGKRRREGKGAAAGGGAEPPAVDGVPAEEAKDIEATRAVLAPVLAREVPHHRIAAACGAHPDDLRGFLEGRVTLTWALRSRLRSAVPGILESLDPLRGGGD